MPGDPESATRDRVVAALRTFPPLSAMNPSRLKNVIANARTFSFDRDQFLLSPGDPSDRVLMVCRGLVLVGVYTPAGVEVAFRPCGPGELLGAHSLLGLKPGQEHARAATSGIAMSLPFDVLREQAEQSASFALALGRLAAQEAVRGRHLLAEARSLDVAGRLARCLLALAGRFGTPDPALPGEPRLIDLPIRHQDLAVLAGATRESISKAMSHFTSSGLIRTERGRISLIDEPGVRFVAWAEEPELEEDDAASYA